VAAETVNFRFKSRTRRSLVSSADRNLDLSGCIAWDTNSPDWPNPERGRGSTRSGRPRAMSKDPENVSLGHAAPGNSTQNASVTGVGLGQNWSRVVCSTSVGPWLQNGLH